MSEFVNKVEGILDETLTGYLGKLEYGNLSKVEKNWGVCAGRGEEVSFGSMKWTLLYTYLFTDKRGDLRIFLTSDSNQLVIQSALQKTKTGATIKDLVAIIKRIPVRRRKEIRNFRKNYSDLECSFLEKLDIICRELNCEPTDLYTPEELDYAKSLE